MPTSVVMPQMGESIAEGTIVRWMKRVGDPVDRDEPLFEISTDKVDAEIPAPAAGVLLAILVREGETFRRGVWRDRGGRGAGGRRHGSPARVPPPSSSQPAETPTVATAPARPVSRRSVGRTKRLRRRRRSSPVRRIAQDRAWMWRRAGSGTDGASPARHPAFPKASPRRTEAAVPGGRSRVPPSSWRPVDISRCRREAKDAEHMCSAASTSRRHTVFHVDFTPVEAARSPAGRVRARRVKMTPEAFLRGRAVAGAARSSKSAGRDTILSNRTSNWASPWRSRVADRACGQARGPYDC